MFASRYGSLHFLSPFLGSLRPFGKGQDGQCPHGAANPAPPDAPSPYADLFWTPSGPL